MPGTRTFITGNATFIRVNATVMRHASTFIRCDQDPIAAAITLARRVESFTDQASAVIGGNVPAEHEARLSAPRVWHAIRFIASSNKADDRMERRMNRIVRKRLEMAERIRDFLRAYPLDDERHASVLARLEALIARLQELAVQQETGRAATRSAAVRAGRFGGGCTTT